MTLLVATLAALAATAVLAAVPAARPRRGEIEPATAGRWLAAALVVLLPLLYAGLMLAGSRSRLETLRVSYVGKLLAYGEGIPLTAGGSPPGSETYEDLPAPRTVPQALRLEPAGEEIATALAVTAGDPVLRLASPSPVVRVDGVALNSYPLADGDRIVLAGRHEGGEPIELVYRRDALARGAAVYPLPGTLVRLLRGSSRVFYLPDVLAALDGGAADWPYRSLLHRPRATGPWHLLIREKSVQVRRGEEVAAAFAEAAAVPADFELELGIAWGQGGRRALRTVRRDRLLVGDGRVEVRFGRPQRQVLRLDGREAPLELGLVVPSAVDRRPELVELEEHSARFSGFAAALGYDPRRRQATLGRNVPEGDDSDRITQGSGEDRQTVELGDLYALGEGADQMLLRVERTAFPRHLLFDLALLALYLAVFLGRVLARHAALAAVVAPVGLLLANRLLFNYRAAVNPPDFFAEGLAEARLALWLVPAAIVFGWSLAWRLRRDPPAASGLAGKSRQGPRTEHNPTASADGRRAREARLSTARRPLPGLAGQATGGWAPLRWPLAGLAIASLGCLLVTRGVGNRPWLALVPALAALVLALLHAQAERPWLGERLKRWRGNGWKWSYRALLISGAAVLAVRWAASLVGMQETLRLPAIEFRVLWTVLQLPLAAAAVALTLHLVDERRRRLASPGSAAVTRHWLAGIAALGVFVALAFLAVALVVGDTGLAIVHALPAVFGLLLLVTWPRALHHAGGRVKAAYGAGLALACVPLVLILAANVAPEQVVRAVDWWGAPAREEAESEGTHQVVDRAAQLSSTRAQQLFRLYMLANPGVLSEVGLEPSERVAIHYHTLQSYAEHAGFFGAGFASTPLPRHLGATYLSDLVPMVFVLAELGVAGTFALALAYLTIAAAIVLAIRARAGARADDRLGAQGTWLAAVALLAFVLPSLYMILANLNLVLFTGKNCNLLALNSLSDVLESGALIGLAVFGLGLGRSN